MKAVILAAGRGIRMMPLTAKTPKPLLKVKGKAIIDYVLDALPFTIDEVIIVVDYLGDQIKKHIGKKNRGFKTRYVTGSDKGNAFSFFATKKYLNDERFLLIYGDELPNPANVTRCMDEDLSVLTFGNLKIDGVMVLNTDIFDYFSPDSPNFKDMVDSFVWDHDVSFVEAKNFIGEINTPKDLERVNG